MKLRILTLCSLIAQILLCLDLILFGPNPLAQLREALALLSLNGGVATPLNQAAVDEIGKRITFGAHGFEFQMKIAICVLLFCIVVQLLAFRSSRLARGAG